MKKLLLIYDVIDRLNPINMKTVNLKNFNKGFNEFH